MYLVSKLIAKSMVAYILVAVLLAMTVPIAAHAQYYGQKPGYSRQQASEYHYHGRYGRGAPSISAGQAQSIALSRIPGRVVGRTRLEDINGRYVYRVDVRTSYGRREVLVDAHTGQIVSIERTMHRGHRGGYGH